MAIRGAKKKEDKPLYRALSPWFFNLPQTAWMPIVTRLMPYLASLWNKAQAEYVAIHAATREMLEKEIQPLFTAAKQDDEAAGHGDLWLAKNKKVTREEWLEQGKQKERVKRMFDLRSLAARRFNIVAFKYLGYERREAEARERTTRAGFGEIWDESNAKKKKEELFSACVLFPTVMVKEFLYYRDWCYDKEAVLKHQINWLPSWSDRDEDVRSSLEEETLKMLHGANLSYLVSRLAGDKDAKPPEVHEEKGFFYAILNRGAFSVNPGRFLKKDGTPRLKGDGGYEIIKPCKADKHDDLWKVVPLKEKTERKKHKNGLPEGHIIVRLANYVPTLVFLIPDWNKTFRDEPGYQRKLVEMACQFRQVTISRRNPLNKRQEANLSKPGALRLSLTLDIPRPKPVAPTDDNTMYVSIGGTSIGIDSKKGREVIVLPCPDKAVRGIKANGQLRGIDNLDDKLSRCQKGSKRWKMLTGLRQRKNAKLRDRGKHNVCNVVKHRKPRSLAYARETIAWHGASNIVFNDDRTRHPDSSTKKENVERGGILGANYHDQNADRKAMLKRQMESWAILKGGKVFPIKSPTFTRQERMKTMRLAPKPGPGCTRQEWLKVKRTRKNNRRRRRYAHVRKIKEAWLARKA